MSTATISHFTSQTSAFRDDQTFARHTTMRVGGPIAQWAEAQNEDELSAILQTVARHNTPLLVLGGGSNLVASDAGFGGVVLHLGRGFATARVEGNLLIAGGAMLLPRLTKVALQHNLGNFEWACGIPGSCGGSLWGNAGARGFNGQHFEGRDCAADFHSLVAFERDGKRVELNRDEVQFAYRKSNLGELIVTQATFALKPLSEEQAQRHKGAVRELLAIRRASQPVNQASAGCIWKNPNAEDCAKIGCRGAGELLEMLDLKGRSFGGARISDLHGNFIINENGATGDDVRALASMIEDEVKAKTGIILQREVRFLD